MRVSRTSLPGVLILEPKVHGDSRGFFLESYNHSEFVAATGFDGVFVQDNHSRSSQGVLRGLHYQVCHPQAKLIRVIVGAVYDVVLDLRRSSSTFGRWFGLELSADAHRQLWVPPGFAHGFLTTSPYAEVTYKVTDYYAPQCERTIRWDDVTLAIKWPLADSPQLSAKDTQGVPFRDAETFD